MKGYVTQKGTRWYAVIYEGLDPVTGRERRRWHAAGTSRADAERLATRSPGRATATTTPPGLCPSARTSRVDGCPASG